MKISKKEVEHVANLARLNLSAEELETMTGQLDTILSYVDKLGELDTTDVKATTHVFSVSNAFREDLVKESLSQEDALKNGPEHNSEFFQVPKII
ncbi:Asp-tRNA(Asn)/Glu-tRNA(Gln) amidotransferase subunit GatC [Desulforhopalus sp. IMCC35007]|uniref:Asp-tRNA(Asn)/Glu-tRNA(Gln) amidotransferase subunit GatC n=1 Tax=Desulforhopalus sp. IMCC35007 TaxID=2569543 RepID=UPI0010AEA3DB|nr:Asp-tRNA(Asn)/Glu-tRNA(Gln) amidotransferase subunit GatC [Desulforhopalus sp. IMCC35007]TKB11650.1 Asp-tRNA(Asn)/Glu-tRNA(Gln) amidotransferase subunit GatC [Desulforhopalus sp. IMCC35007]